MKMEQLFRRVLFLTLCLFCATHQASAQRTSVKEPFIGVGYSASYFASPKNALTHGLSLSVGQYMMEGYWKAGAQFNNFHQFVWMDDSVGYQWFDYSYYAVAADVNLRIVDNYSRSLNLYIGAGVFLGYREYGTFINRLGNGIPDSLMTSDGVQVNTIKGDFLYGMRVNLELEAFITKKIALVLNVQPTLPFSHTLPSDTFHLLAELGLRFNL